YTTLFRSVGMGAPPRLALRGRDVERVVHPDDRVDRPAAEALRRRVAATVVAVLVARPEDVHQPVAGLVVAARWRAAGVADPVVAARMRAAGDVVDARSDPRDERLVQVAGEEEHRLAEPGDDVEQLVTLVLVRGPAVVLALPARALAV